jgi:hypothetical protein
MKSPNYWLDLFTIKTWEEFNEAGAQVSGFREKRWKTVQQVRPGDFLLCYLTGISRFVGVLKVQSEAYKDESAIWGDDVFPSRLKVQSILQLTPETGVPILDLRDCLSIFKNLDSSPSSWTGFVRGSPSKRSQADGEAILNAIQKAGANPTVRPFNKAKLAYRPKRLESAIGSVVVPDTEPMDLAEPPQPKEISAHTEIQWLLAKLGSDMGLDVWVARNDKNKEISGKHFSDLPRLKSELPLQFDEATNKTIELIDVLWLQKHSIVAAFEIESTTSIYSGLLRMSDLISMQPNLNIPLYIVAPDERREKVVGEINRPTFSKLAPPMYEMCKFIPFSTLKQELVHVGKFVQHLKPDFIDELAESCEIEEV